MTPAETDAMVADTSDIALERLTMALILCADTGCRDKTLCMLVALASERDALRQALADERAGADERVPEIWGMGYIAGKYEPDPTADWDHVWPDYKDDVFRTARREGRG